MLAAAAAATTVLFLVYAALVARVLRAGEDVECHCFGTLGDDRVTSVTLARNLVLVLLAALATGFGASGSGLVPAVGDFQGSDWWWPVMTALVVLTALLIFRPGGTVEEPPSTRTRSRTTCGSPCRSASSSPRTVTRSSCATWHADSPSC